MELADFSKAPDTTAADVADAARELGLRIGARERDELATLVSAARSAAPAARVAAAHAVRREHPFAFSLGAREPLISGVIDLVATEADGSRLVLDYKSDRVGAEVDLDELVQRDYAVQRLLYALAVLREGATEVEIVHWFLERQQWASARYGAGERLVLEEQLAERIAAARERRFAPQPGAPPRPVSDVSRPCRSVLVERTRDAARAFVAGPPWRRRPSAGQSARAGIARAGAARLKIPANTAPKVLVADLIDGPF